MYKYGLELELFQIKDNKIVIPEAKYPLDGCGAIIELRSKPHDNIYDASFEIKKQWKKYLDDGLILEPFSLEKSNRHKFSIEEYRKAQQQCNKDYSVNILNLYKNKTRRLLPQTVVAVSLQINISNIVSHITDYNKELQPVYGLLDIPQIIKGLDIEFHKEITNTKRIKGEYAIKDNNIRLEYRSLPSEVFIMNDFEQRINKVITSLK